MFLHFLKDFKTEIVNVSVCYYHCICKQKHGIERENVIYELLCDFVIELFPTHHFVHLCGFLIDIDFVFNSILYATTLFILYCMWYMHVCYFVIDW